MLTRRRLLGLVPAAAVAARLDAQLGVFSHKSKKQPALQTLVFFGTNTARPAAKGIYLSRFDPLRGQFTAPTLAAACVSPSFMAVNEVSSTSNQKHPTTRRLVYAVNEGDANTSGVSTYELDPATGILKLLGSVSAGGRGPCYISVAAGGRSAYVANYAGGTIASYAVLSDGRLSNPVDRIDFHDEALGHPGPNKARQDGPHPHSAMMSPDNRFVLVNDLGNDDIALFPTDVKTGRLGKPHLFTNIAPGSGPRHLAFHPNGRWAYGIDEMTSRIDQYLYTDMRQVAGVEAQAALSSAGHSVSTLDANFHGVNTAAEIAVSPLGDFVYASNRGEDSLVVFSVDAESGDLAFVQRISCGGKTPRHFTLDPTSRWIVCGNQDSASVTVFARDRGTGKLSGPVQTLSLESPMFTLFV